MRIPKIGDTITPKIAQELCIAHGLFDISRRIELYRDQFKDWVFDGASCTPDALVSRACGIPNLTRIALVHDIKYGYGIPGDDRARMDADLEFAIAVLRDGADPLVAQAMFESVRYGGCEALKMSFSWGFARR